MVLSYAYNPRILEQLARHGLRPARTTPPERLRDALNDLYRYEIRGLRHQLLAGRIAKDRYAAHVIELRKRYWLLSVPIRTWTVPAAASAEDE